MSSEVVKIVGAGVLMESVLIQGDLSKLNEEQRVSYYNKVCESIGVNPLTKPFEYMTLNGKLTLYAKRDATDQLRSIKNVSVKIISREKVGDVFTVTAQASIGNRTDESIGAVHIGNLRGDSLANALMKAETKAKRRVTLSICGLGWLDETEVEVPIQKVEIKKTEPKQIQQIETKKTGAKPERRQLVVEAAKAKDWKTEQIVALLKAEYQGTKVDAMEEEQFEGLIHTLSTLGYDEWLGGKANGEKETAQEGTAAAPF